MFKKQTLNELQSSAFINNIEEQNKMMLAQQGMLPGGINTRTKKEWDAIKQELHEEKRKEAEEWKLAMAIPFKNNFSELLRMDPDSFSVTKAIYLCESAWYNSVLTWQQFSEGVKARVDLVRQILKRENLSPKNNMALNYAIQKLYKQENQFIDKKTTKVYTVARLRYDFNDFMGEKNWDNMFVTKLMATGKGQCHSMPLLYLAIAQSLGAKAYLSLSPEHSFIQFFDKEGRRYNFETTNSHLVTQAWLMQSGFVNATALKNRTYLDTLSSRQLYAQLLSDLLQNYTNKIGYDETAREMTKQILAIHPANMVALMTETNLNTFIAKDKLKEAGYPPVSRLNEYPEANEAYLRMQRSYEALEQTGYQEMPAEMYQQWLKTATITHLGQGKGLDNK